MTKPFDLDELQELIKKLEPPREYGAILVKRSALERFTVGGIARAAVWGMSAPVIAVDDGLFPSPPPKQPNHHAACAAVDLWILRRWAGALRALRGLTRLRLRSPLYTKATRW